MAGTRALFASIGASVVLMAGAALSLLAVSAVFAFGDWSDAPSSLAWQPVLVVAGATQTQPAADTHARTTTSPIVVAAPQGRTMRVGSRSHAQAPLRVRPTKRSVATLPASGTPSTPGPSPPVVRPAAPLPAAVKKRTGDGVRKVGDGLSSTLQDTGAALSDATKPLVPPVASAVRAVVDAIAALLNNATNGIAGALDKLLPPK